MCGTFLERHDSGDVHTGHEEQHEWEDARALRIAKAARQEATFGGQLQLQSAVLNFNARSAVGLLRGRLDRFSPPKLVELGGGGTIHIYIYIFFFCICIYVYMLSGPGLPPPPHPPPPPPHGIPPSPSGHPLPAVQPERTHANQREGTRENEPHQSRDRGTVCKEKRAILYGNEHVTMTLLLTSAATIPYISL